MDDSADDSAEDANDDDTEEEEDDDTCAWAAELAAAEYALTASDKLLSVCLDLAEPGFMRGNLFCASPPISLSKLPPSDVCDDATLVVSNVGLAKLFTEETRLGETAVDCGLCANLLLYGDVTLKGDSEDALSEWSDMDSVFNCGGLVAWPVVREPSAAGELPKLPDVDARDGVFGLPILDFNRLSYACDESLRFRCSKDVSPCSLN